MTPSGHIVGHQDVQSTSRLVRSGNVLGMQQRLRRAGYGIAADGVWGPQSQAAYTHYTNTLGHFQRQQWNLRSQQLAAHPVHADPQELLQHFGFAGATALRRQANQSYAARTFNQEVVLRHPTPQRPGLTRYQGRNYVTHLVPTRYGQSIVVGGPSHPSAVGRFFSGAYHSAAHFVKNALEANPQEAAFLGNAADRRQQQIAARNTLISAVPAIGKPLYGEPVGAWDVANTAMWAGGPLRFAGAGIEGGLAAARFMEAARVAEAAGEAERASRLYQLARAAREGAGAGATAFRESTGVIRPAASRLNLPLTPAGWAIRRSGAVQEAYARVDQELAAGRISRREALDEKRSIRLSATMPSKVLGHGKTGLLKRLELPPQEPGLASELHPQSLYQHVPPTLSAEGMPERLRIRGMTPKIYNLIKRGAEYRDWYQRGAAVIQDFADRLALSPKQAAGIIAVTSQGANPTFNLRRAAEAVQAVRRGEDISHTMLGGQFDKVKHIIENPETFDWSGVKTNNYFANFYKQLNPADYEAMYGADAKHATVDRHMAQMFLGKEAPTPAQYKRVKDVMVRAGEALGWSPEEVQAAAWVPWKAQQMGVTQSVKGFLREATAAGTLPKELQIPERLSRGVNTLSKEARKEVKALHTARSAWAREQLTGTLPAGWEKHLPTAADAYERGQARYRAPEGEHPGTGDYLYQHELPKNDHTFNSSIAQVHSEIRPEEHFWPERAAMFDRLPAQQKIEYARLTDQAIGHEFEDALGMQVAGKRTGEGIWRGKYAPGIAHHVFVGDEITAGTEAELNALSAAKGMAKHQTSVSWGRPLPAGEGPYKGIHWTPPEGANPAYASSLMDTVAGEGNVGFIHAPDGGYYVIDFSGQAPEHALANLGGKQTQIGWDGGYTIDARIARQDDWGNRYQAALDALPAEQRSRLELALTRVRARTDQIDEHFFGRKGAHIVSLEEAKALAAQGTHVFHGTGGITAEQIMAERRLRVGDRHREGAWVTTNPETADWYASGFTGHGQIVAIPKDQIPFGQGYAEHPFGAYGSPDDILFQHQPGRFDHLSLDELHAHHDEIMGRYNRMIDELAAREGKPYKVDTAMRNLSAKKLARKGLPNLTAKQELRNMAEQRFQGVLDNNPEHPYVVAHNADMAEANALRQEIYRRNDALFQQRPGKIKGAYQRLPGGRGAISQTELADLGTWQHEMMHHIRPHLTPELEQVAREAVGLKPGEAWTTAAEEHFANGWLSFLREGKEIPRNWVDTLETVRPRLQAKYEAGELPDITDAERGLYKTLAGHDISSPVGQALLRYTRLAARVAGHETGLVAPYGHRDPEAAQTYLEALNEEAAAQGHGITGISIPRLEPGAVTPETGGAAGAEVRRVMAGRLPEGLGPYEKAGMSLEVRSARQARVEKEALKKGPLARKAAASRSAYEAAGGGVEGHYASMAELRGELPGVELGQRPDLNGKAADFLMNFVTHHPAIEGKGFDQARARAALIKVLNGETPQRSEEKLLYRLLGKEMDARSIREFARSAGPGDWLREIVNLPRSLEATMDQSAMFRHMMMTLMHSPRVWARQFPKMYRALASGSFHEDWMRAIEEHPLHALARKAGVPFTDLGVDPMLREEQYMSVLAEKIPGFGRLVKASDRSYSGALNGARMELFDKLVRSAAAEGHDLRDPHALESIGKFVGSATGRGDLGILKKYTVALQSTFFSPRLLASRVNFMSPFYYASLHPFARKEAAKGMIRLLTTAGIVMKSLQMAGAQVGMDPTSANFGRVVIGNSRIDLFGGFQDPIRIAAQMYEGKITSSTTGRVEKLSGKVAGTNYADILWRFFQNKLAPVPGGAVEALQQKDPTTGQPLGWKEFGLPKGLVPTGGLFGTNRAWHPGRAVAQSFWLNHMLPLVVQDMAEMPPSKEYLMPGPVLGIGVHTYGLPPAGEKQMGKLEKDMQAAGLGKPPAAIIRDAHWKGRLDQAVYAGQSSYDKAKAAAKIYDERYGTHLAETLPAQMSAAGAEAYYLKLRSLISPLYDKYLSSVDKVLRAKQGAQMEGTPPAAPHHGGGGIIHSIEHGIGSLLGAAASPLATGSASAAVMPRGAANRRAANVSTASGGGGGGAAGLPPELGSAIESAAQRYNVPASTLAGIWRIESGSTYPNPAVNQLGYGGLFGTTKWNASTQEQANYAASTLRHLLDVHGGNMAAALHAYSGGGYTSVPGAGGGWHAGRGAGGSQFAPAAMGGFAAAPGPPIHSVVQEALQMMASGTYNPSKLLSDALHTMSDVPLQGNVQGINFQLPKGGKAAGAARGAIALAEHYLGTPYVWGGESPGGFDCSGLLQYVWARMGVRIPRTSQEQWRAGRRVGRGQLRPGDAVFFEPTASGPGHVGMYIGGGRFIESPHTGATVRISNLRGYPGYMGARRFSRR